MQVEQPGVLDPGVVVELDVSARERSRRAVLDAQRPGLVERVLAARERQAGPAGGHPGRPAALLAAAGPEEVGRDERAVAQHDAGRLPQRGDPQLAAGDQASAAAQAERAGPVRLARAEHLEVAERDPERTVETEAGDPRVRRPEAHVGAGADADLVVARRLAVGRPVGAVPPGPRARAAVPLDRARVRCRGGGSGGQRREHGGQEGDGEADA
ncbi:MAG TPA: hypothetical protein VJT75_13735 [Thermoleophilaceae bacterium]|nr:hypothetical protein [Thermoleophilaceae bacterium]